MTLIFDKNTQDERRLPIDRVYFRGTEGVVQGVYDKQITSASDIPDLSSFVNNPVFINLVIDDNGIEIPVSTVNYIRDVTGNLYEKNYNLTVTLGSGE